MKFPGRPFFNHILG